MKPAHICKTAAFLTVATMWLAPRGAVGQDEVTTLLGQLAGNGLDRSALLALEGHPPDPRIIPGLEAAFESREAKNDKQAIAVTLLRLGEKSDKYFDFLAGFARVAVEDRTPYFQVNRGQFTLEFEAWCAQHGKDPRTVASIQIGVYPEDVLALAKSQDPRAAELFRKGLESRNPTVVGFCVEGLGRLQDVTAIPLIAKAAERLPGAKRAIAMQLPWYGRFEAYQLMERLEPDRRSREFHIDQVERARLAEAKRVLSRTGGAPATPTPQPLTPNPQDAT